MKRNQMYFSQLDMLLKIFNEIPTATARINGSESYPEIKGVAQFYQLANGVLLVVEVMGLPSSNEPCKNGIHALHIHEGGACSGNVNDPFANARSHYSPKGCEHPYHAGDLPPLFENQGYAMNVFYTERFWVKDVLGKTIVLHENIDDFTSQPAGNAGKKIACGVIRPLMIN